LIYFSKITTIDEEFTLKEVRGGNDQNQENEIDELEDMEYLGPGFDSGFYFYFIKFTSFSVLCG